MKKTILMMALAITSTFYGQTAQSIIDTWSFDKIDVTTLNDEEKAALPLLESMFNSFQIVFEADTYTLSVMGQEESGAYTFKNKEVILRDGGKIAFTSNESGLFSIGNAAFTVKRGAYVKEDVTYTYITQDAYPGIAFDAKLLYKKWKVLEVKPSPDDSDGELTTSLLSLMTYQFNPDGTFLLTVMGQGKPANWSIGEEKGMLILDIRKDDEDIYSVKMLTEDGLLMQIAENNAFIYLVPDTE